MPNLDGTGVGGGHAKRGRTYNLDPDLLYPFEVGAMLLAILAWPDPGEEEQLRFGAEALAAQAFHALCKAFPDEAEGWRAACPHYVSVSQAEINRRLRQLDRRLRDRMAAARMALGFMEQGLTGRAPRLPSSMKRHSLNELSILVQTDLPTISDPEMIERRVWRQTRPVIALAVAMQLWARAASEGGTKLIGYPLDNGELHAAVIELAQRHEPLVLRDRRLGIGEDDLVRVRLQGRVAP
ncbi:MAG TPA: hypothetical protein VME40_02460 [Caulobacteraceae bacterium]|nr:hypothetical protein [Caulobacteraceae bacterium]